MEHLCDLQFSMCIAAWHVQLHTHTQHGGPARPQRTEFTDYMSALSPPEGDHV